MKRLSRRIALLALLVFLIPHLAGCEKSSSAVELETKQEIWDAQLERITSYVDEMISSTLMNATYEQFEQYIQGGNRFGTIPFDQDLMRRWGDFTALHGRVTDARCIETEREEDGYVSYILLTGEDGEMMRLSVYSSENNVPVRTTLERYAEDSGKTMGQRFKEAGGNTVVGLLVVFAVLVLLSLVISAMKFTNAFDGKKKAEEAAKAGEPVSFPKMPGETETVVLPQEDAAELVAVIAAAIAAYTEEEPSGYIVRSIRKVKKSRR